jgi:branched-chain amino acid transport system substrate-binding protein
MLRTLRLRSVGLAVAVGVAAVAVVGCGSTTSSSSAGSAAGGSTSATAVASTGPAPTCGAGTHTAARGTPLTFGSIITKIPGVDFTGDTDAIQAYFNCVNANGGIDGHPLRLIVETEAANPQQAASDATQLLQSDHVVGMVGNMSLIDCSVNGSTYTKLGIKIIGPGVDTGCYQTPSYASVITGPEYDPQIVAQYLVKQAGAKGGFVSVTTQGPGTAVYNNGAVAVAKAAGIANAKGLTQPVPVNDPQGLALQLANQAGNGGGAIVGFTGPELVKVLNAIGQQGLITRAHWGCVGLCDDPSVAKAISSQWSGQLFVGSDYPTLDSNRPSMQLLRSIQQKYGGGQPVNALTQFGFTSAQILASALVKLPSSALNRAGINKAIGSITNYKTDMLCAPWTFGQGVYHVPVSSSSILVYKNGAFVPQSDGACIKLDPVTPQLKAAGA